MFKNPARYYSILTLSAVWIGGCYIQPMPVAQPVVVAQAAPPPAEAQPVAVADPPAEAVPEPAPVEQPAEYYYAGAHLYPEALGGEWCPINEPHTHDFPPDHPDYYAYDNGYYYYAGRPGEVYVEGRPPPGVRVYVVREGSPHPAGRLRPDADRPRFAHGHYPPREGHAAPLHPEPTRVAEEHAGPARASGNTEPVGHPVAHTESVGHPETLAHGSQPPPGASEHAAPKPAGGGQQVAALSQPLGGLGSGMDPHPASHPTASPVSHVATPRPQVATKAPASKPTPKKKK